VSGFLQRLASGVLHAQPAIHPAVGAIWSTGGTNEPGIREPLGTAEPFESSVEVGAPRMPHRADRPAPAAAQPSTQQPAKLQVQPERSAAVPESAIQRRIAEAGAFPPLVAFPHQNVSVLPPAPQANANPQQSEAIPPPRHQATSPEHTGPRPRHRIETARPLVPAPPMPVPVPAGARIAPSFPPPSQRQAQPAPSLAEESDAIEIHIGRIEVLAAPPRPAQPAAPRPARKSLDLGEYLRGERRSR
jgi:hypothetical protein